MTTVAGKHYMYMASSSGAPEVGVVVGEAMSLGVVVLASTVVCGVWIASMLCRRSRALSK
jgi:hypothetical protein